MEVIEAINEARLSRFHCEGDLCLGDGVLHRRL